MQLLFLDYKENPMWLAIVIQIPLFTILVERVKIQEKQKPVVLRFGKAFESDRSRHPE